MSSGVWVPCVTHWTFIEPRQVFMINYNTTYNQELHEKNSGIPGNARVRSDLYWQE